MRLLDDAPLLVATSKIDHAVVGDTVHIGVLLPEVLEVHELMELVELPDRVLDMAQVTDDERSQKREVVVLRECLRHVYNRQRASASQRCDIKLDGKGSETLGMLGQFASVELGETDATLEDPNR